MAKLSWNGGSDGDDSTTSSTTSTSGLGSLLPSWIWKLKPLATRPAAFIRGVVFRPIVKGILAIASSFVSVILLLGRGSAPGLTGSQTVWGVEDVFLYIGGVIIDLGVWFATTLFDTLIAINRAVVPAIPGPIEGLVVYGFVLLELIVLGELVLRGSRALLESIPIVSELNNLLFGSGG